MKLQSNKNYNSTKFVVLREVDGAARRVQCSKVFWISLSIILSVLIGIAVGYFLYKALGGQDITEEFPIGTSHEIIKNSSFNFKARILNEKQKWITKNRSELTCREFQLQAIPLDFIFNEKNTPRVQLPSVQNFISLDLLLYYEDLINKEEARNLKLIFDQYRLKLSRVKSPRDFFEFLGSLKSNKFKFYTGLIERDSYDLELNDFKYYFDLTNELYRWYEYLDHLRGFLSHYERQRRREDYSVKITKVNFIQFTTETQENIYRFSYPFNITEKKLEEINKVLMEWTKPVKMKINNSSLVFFNKGLLLSEINQSLKSLDVVRLQNVFIFASGIIYLDEDLTLSGVNVAIIAPSWVFMKKVKVNLNGNAGEEHKMAVAKPGEHGKPGNPGRNAGDFLGVGDFNERFLKVYSNGGRGGNGQNGADGRHGLNFTRPDPPKNKPTCFLKLNSFNNTFGKHITHYKVYGEVGCGGPGMNGGVAGEGGEGGEIILIKKKHELKLSKGLKGNSGSYGKGGAGGIGGRDGCFYEVLDVDDEVLYPITTIKCPIGEVLPSGESGKDNTNGGREVISTSKDNLSISNALFQFIRSSIYDFLQHNDPLTMSFFKEYIQLKFFRENLLGLYTLFEVYDNYALYNILMENMFKDKGVVITPQHPFLKSIILGKMSALKKNVNYFFIDYNNYLTIIQRSIKHINENILEFPPVSQLKEKIDIKLHKINENAKLIKTELITRTVFVNESIGKLLEGFSQRIDYESLGELLHDKRLYCVMLVGTEIMVSLLDSNSKGEEVDLENLCSLKNEKCNEIVTTASTFSYNSHKELKLFEDLRNVLEKVKEGRVKEHLLELRDSFDSLEKTAARSGGKVLFERLTEEVEHFLAVYDFVEWEAVEKSFVESLEGLNWGEGLLKNKLIEVMINLEYNLALDAARQRVYPFVKLDNRFQSHNNTTDTEFQEQINRLRDVHKRNSFCQNNLEAVFDKSSAFREFYFWPNAEIKNKLRDLFGGVEINLKSSIINQHVLDKNYVKFNSIKLEFECRENNLRPVLENVLNNFKIRMTHSGYSYYNWKGETHVIVSEEVTFDYSFRRRRNGEPEFYNSLFKKCQTGDIMLSPFTTWRIQLLPYNNDADYYKLSPFIDLIDLILIGTGTFVS